MRYVLDTDALSVFERGDARLIVRLRAAGVERFGMAIVSAQELLAGRLAVVHRSRRADLLIRAYLSLADALEFCTTVEVLGYDGRAAAMDARLAASVRRLGTMDRRIAAICIAQGATLVTGNVRDFGLVPGLSILDWHSDG